jgi:hypothetical protein
MPKTYKAFIKEYSMGLQVPSTSYLKGVGSLKNLTKKEYMAVGTVGMDRAPLKKKNEVSDKLKGKVLDRKIKRAKVKFRQGLKDKRP